MRTFFLAFAIALAVVTGIGGCVYWFVVLPHQRAVAVQEGNTEAGARTESGSQAVDTVNQQGHTEAQIDEQTKEATSDIQSTSGATTKVAPDTNHAGLRALCMRDVYRDSARCRALLQSHP